MNEEQNDRDESAAISIEAVPSTHRLAPYHFKPGKSGNPTGRGKGLGPTDMLRRMFHENSGNAEAFAAAVIAHARNGNAAFARMVFDRLDGLLTQKVEVASGPSSLQAGMAALLDATQTESAVPAAATASSEVVQVVAEVVDDDDEAGTYGD